MDALEQELTIEMIPDGLHRQIALTIGTENLLKLAQLTGGQRIYVVKKDELLKPVRDRHIRKEFNGFNYLELAKKYGLTETHVRRICGSGCLEEQIKLF